MGINTEMVRLLNAELAQTGQVVFRSQGRARTDKGEYTLLNIRTGEKRYLSLTELEEMCAEVKRANSRS